MPVTIKTKKEARGLFLSGAKQVFDAVVPTLGPWGRNVSIHRKPLVMKDGSLVHIPPLITKDGVTVARNVTSLADPFENDGAQIVKEAAERTNKYAGDGTTTATLLTYEMMKDGAKLLDEGANAIHVKRGMQKACDAVCEKLRQMSRPVQTLEEMRSIATISAAGDEEIGSMVSMVIDEIGKNGAVTISPGMGTGIDYTITNGMQIAVGYASPYFAGPKGVATINQTYILVTTEKITSIRTLAPILSKIAERNEEKVNLVIFSSGVHGDALTTIATNHLDHPDKFRFLILNPPFYGEKQQEILEDIAIATGAQLIDKKLGRSIETMSLAHLGEAGRVDATAGVTTIISPKTNKEAVQERISLIQAFLDTAEESEKDYLKMRIAGLEGKIATIYVGGSSQVEQQERQHRVEDAVSATRAAKETGIVPGGGTAFIRCVDVVKAEDFSIVGEKNGALIVLQALTKQLMWVASNAGEKADQVALKVMGMKESEGFNAETGQYGDMFEMKVIDPTKVPITALQNAVSVAGMFLTLEVSITEQE